MTLHWNGRDGAVFSLPSGIQRDFYTLTQSTELLEVSPFSLVPPFLDIIEYVH